MGKRLAEAPLVEILEAHGEHELRDPCAISRVYLEIEFESDLSRVVNRMGGLVC